MEKAKKINFFKRIKMAIFKLEDYIQFVNEKTSKAVWFCFKMSFLCALIILISALTFIYTKYGSPVKLVDKMVPDFVYYQGKLSVDVEDKKSSDEKKMIGTVMKEIEPTLPMIIEGEYYDKTQLVTDINNNEKEIMIASSITLLIEACLELILMWMLYALMTSLIGSITLSFSRIKMKYSKLFALSIYASTLTIILTVAYSLAMAMFGIYIELFDYLSMVIAYIYITAVIYMIKSDLIKQQVELIKIATIQAKVKEKETEEKEKEETEKQKEKENTDKKEKSGEKAPEKKEDDVDDEPDGSEI